MITVAIASYGDSMIWLPQAERARASAESQAPVVQVHLPLGTLAEARNECLNKVETEFVVFLDADDQLAPDYIEQMEKGTADVRGPMVNFMQGISRIAWQPRVAGHKHDCVADCLPHGNWLVIGSCARTDLLRQVGGFEEFPVYEDWALWLRCWKAGATFEFMPEAVYLAEWRRESRNKIGRAHV